MSFGLLPFAALVVETPPLQLANWFEYLETFLQDGGGFALVGLWAGLAWPFVRALSEGGATRVRISLPLLALAVVATGLYAGGFIVSAIVAARAPEAAAASTVTGAILDDPDRGKWFNYLFTAGGALALLGVLVPFARDLMSMRLRRVWALTRLTVMEALRRRVLLVFVVLLLVFLFPSKWWDPTIKPEGEIEASIDLVYSGATPLLLLAAGLLSSFSIPTDIRNQTIHTVVTKPVEKFEIVVGRFLGYVALLSAILFGFVGLSLGMIYFSRVSDEAREKSMKARVPVFADLKFRRGDQDFKGESVGREWEYRQYIQGGPKNTNPFRAVWLFRDRDVTDLADRDYVTCEFSFDIFRTSKGEENKGVYCTFMMANRKVGDSMADLAAVSEKFVARTTGKKFNPDPGATPSERNDWKEIERISGELGYYEYAGKEVVDYHTQSIPIPSIMFRPVEGAAPTATKDNPNPPSLRMLVRCDSRTQFLGVARNDLYLLANEQSFALNYFKGSLGLWMRLVLVIGVAVAGSTYLNGAVTLMTVGFLVLLGYNRWFVLLLAMVTGGEMQNNPGPADSLRKLIANESLGVAPDEGSATQRVTFAMDTVFRWGMRRVLNLVPNLERLNWTEHVGSGFNIPAGELAMNFLGVCAYLFLWAVMGHYVFKWREIATW